jgi:hypothetical protein
LAFGVAKPPGAVRRENAPSRQIVVDFDGGDFRFNVVDDKR